MSASETGDEAPLVQFFSSVRNKDSASAPASRTVSASSARLAAMTRSPGISALTSANRQSLDAQRRCIDAVAEFQIVGGGERFEHLEQMAGNRHFAHRTGDLAVLDPESGRAATVVAGDTVDAGADQIGDIKTLFDIGDQFSRRHVAGFEMQIVGPG